MLFSDTPEKNKMRKLSERGPAYSRALGKQVDHFAFANFVYAREVRAFAFEESHNNLFPRILTRHSRKNVSRSPCRLLLVPPFAVKPSYRSLSASNRGVLIGDNQHNDRTCRRSLKGFSQELDSVLEVCNKTEQEPKVHHQVEAERKIMKKYSARINWTAEALVQNAECEVSVLAPLVDYCIEDKKEREDMVKHAVVMAYRNLIEKARRKRTLK